MSGADLLGLTLEDATRLAELSGLAFSIRSTGTPEGAAAFSRRIVRACIHEGQWFLTVCSIPDPYG